MNVDTRLFAKSAVHMVRTMHPAHLRYYRIVGFVTADRGDHWEVAVRGSFDIRETFLVVALMRRNRNA